MSSMIPVLQYFLLISFGLTIILSMNLYYCTGSSLRYTTQKEKATQPPTTTTLTSSIVEVDEEDPTVLLTNYLLKSCKKHAAKYDTSGRAPIQLILDFFMVGLRRPILPAFGVLLAVVRSNLISSVWDDDLDFRIDSRTFDDLFRSPGEGRELQLTAPFTDITETLLGIAMVDDVIHSLICSERNATPKEYCPSITVIKVNNPNLITASGDSHSNESPAKVLVRDYFNQIKSKTSAICLTFVRLKWVFLKVIVQNCKTEEEYKVEQEEKNVKKSSIHLNEWRHMATQMDIFPTDYLEYDWTCGKNDFKTRRPSPRCVARALIAQPIYLSTSRFRTIDSIDMLVPKEMYARSWLDAEYGVSWSTHARLCEHRKFDTYKDCENKTEDVSMISIQKIMDELESCRSLKNGGTRVTSERVREIRRRSYEMIASEAVKGKEKWRALYYDGSDGSREMILAEGIDTLANALQQHEWLQQQGRPLLFYYEGDREEGG